MDREDYDIVVIGGGINGAGVAQAAAAQGYSVLVLEEKQLASGTSSRSSKLIHGGLRYLETAQFSLVRECLQERRYLLKNAPDLVKLKPFYIPVYPQTSRRPWKLRAGLSLYGALTGFSLASRFRSLPRREWDTLDGLDTTNLQAVFEYWDAQTDDAKLTQAVMQSAQELGAELCVPAEFLSAQRLADRWQLHYRVHQTQFEAKARVILNAAGPWVNQVLSRITPNPSQLPIDLIQGTHLIFDGQVNKGIYYVEAPQDHRAVFVMPWYQRLMIGTTEIHYEGNPREASPTESEINYLTEVLGHYFPHYSGQQPIDAFAGLRVLPKGDGHAFSRPRDTIYHRDNAHKPTLLTLYGGKLTAYRATAEAAIRCIKHGLPDRIPLANTHELPLQLL